MDTWASKAMGLPFWEQNILLFQTIKLTIHNENLSQIGLLFKGEYAK